jgi:hypothetical protein
VESQLLYFAQNSQMKRKICLPGEADENTVISWLSRLMGFGSQAYANSLQDIVVSGGGGSHG